MQENQRRDLNFSRDSGSKRGAEEDEEADDQAEMKDHEPYPPEAEGVTEAAMRGHSDDNAIGNGEGSEEINSYSEYMDDEEEYNGFPEYIKGGRYEEYMYYNHADYYDGGDDNKYGDDNEEENNENKLYWYGSSALPSRITNCSDIGNGFQLCFQIYVENTRKSDDRLHQDGDDAGELDENTLWELRNNDDEAKDDDHVDDDDESGDNSDGILIYENTSHIMNSFPALVPADRLNPDLYFIDDIPGYQISNEGSFRNETNSESESSVVTTGRERSSGLQSKWFAYDTEDNGTANNGSESIIQTLPAQGLNFTTSGHETPFEEVYNLVMHSREVSDDDKHHIASLERLRRHVKRLSGLETFRSEYKVRRIVKRQLSGTEACAVFRRRRRREVAEPGGRKRGSRSRRGIGNVGRSLEQGNPRVRQLISQYKAMCDFISLSVFEK